MRLEFHQLEHRLEHLRVRRPDRQRRLLASLATSGQQTPIVVVQAEQPDRYLIIDGYQRIAALQQLGRDTVEAVVWSLSEVEALLLDRSMRSGDHETALEEGWLLVELEQRFNYGLEELARRFDRSTSWVSRRMGLVELLPESVQQQVRGGAIAAHVAMKFLVPVARSRPDDCRRMAEGFARYRLSSREAGQLYAAWRTSTAAVRERLLNEEQGKRRKPNIRHRVVHIHAAPCIAKARTNTAQPIQKRLQRLHTSAQHSSELRQIATWVPFSFRTADISLNVLTDMTGIKCNTISAGALLELSGASDEHELLDVRAPEYASAPFSSARLTPLNELNIEIYRRQHNPGACPPDAGIGKRPCCQPRWHGTFLAIVYHCRSGRLRKWRHAGVEASFIPHHSFRMQSKRPDQFITVAATMFDVVSKSGREKFTRMRLTQMERNYLGMLTSLQVRGITAPTDLRVIRPQKGVLP